jgi:hypothetical protein
MFDQVPSSYRRLKGQLRMIWKSVRLEGQADGTARKRGVRRTLPIAVASGVLAAAAVGMGVASASIPGPNGDITGCYSDHGGRLRVIDAQSRARCRRDEKQLTWSQTGPPGRTGRNHLYIVGFNKVSVGPSSTGVASLENVPAGTYLVSVTGQVNPNSDDSLFPVITCSLSPTTTSYAPDSLPLADPTVDGNLTVPIGAQGEAVLAISGSISFSCALRPNGPGPPPVTLEGVMTAIPVNGVN